MSNVAHPLEVDAFNFSDRDITRNSVTKVSAGRGEGTSYFKAGKNGFYFKDKRGEAWTDGRGNMMRESIRVNDKNNMPINDAKSYENGKVLDRNDIKGTQADREVMTGKLAKSLDAD